MLTRLPLGPGAASPLVSAPIESLVDLPGVDTVYNLEVEGFHTYFVEGLLVHNWRKA